MQTVTLHQVRINSVAGEELPAELQFQLPKGKCELTQQEQEAVLRIARYPLDLVRERLIAEQTLTAEKANEAILEFRKFLTLILFSETGIGMMSKEVDEVWHAFILFTREYSEFCLTTFGRYVHHAPATRTTPVPKKAGVAFQRLYKSMYGKLPAVWHSNTSDCSGTTNCQDRDCITCNNCSSCHDPDQER